MATYVHCVYFTCKEGTSEAAIQALAVDGEAMLKDIPSVRRIHCGPRDATMQRDVNDTAYDVGLCVLFDDKAGYELYSAHEHHQAFLAKHRDGWAEVRVFDFVGP